MTLSTRERKPRISRFVILVLDGFGIGALPDAAAYGDSDANTLRNTYFAVGGVYIPNLIKLGLANIEGNGFLGKVSCPAGAFGRMAEASPGKDTITGHWEMMGVVLRRPFPTYPSGFPEAMIREFENRIGRKVLGNRPASGTEIIKELGDEHVRTGRPIVYTSADSVFQIAAHEDVVKLEELYWMCEVAKEMFVDSGLVARVIARPFSGTSGSYMRTERRRDFSARPPRKTALDLVVEAGGRVVAVGKIDEIFGHSGISESYPVHGNAQVISKTTELLRENFEGVVLANLVDFDMLYGHRNDPVGYAKALEAFDMCLPEIMANLKGQDVLVISSDHGCDPVTPSTDHSREYVPLIVYGERVRSGAELGTRNTFADLGKTIVDAFGIAFDLMGTSCLDIILTS